ncbi:hypothetical protein LS684_17390 [Cytobacillus spongiae]|uniref:hypothetical protein n=1 Tax=Cytobacillus spongiae TaxID=2901381 RepID=UPI001F4792A9|nr:hypothetical protein [Cytobacillus spongiae]UII55386.1 hypothetical protein LS684_17390 [Cytobacillus spongiae]
MTGEQLQDYYSIVKKLGVKLEAFLNQALQEHLNEGKVIDLFKTKGNACETIVHQLQEYSEAFATIANVPTKTDIANLTKLIIQLEEKMDQLEEQVYQLKETALPTKRKRCQLVFPLLLPNQTEHTNQLHTLLDQLNERMNRNG